MFKRENIQSSVAVSKCVGQKMTSMLTSLYSSDLSALSDSDFDGIAGCSGNLVAVAAGTCILGRPCMPGRLPRYRRGGIPSWTAGAGIASYSCGSARSRSRWRCAGGPWCRGALGTADEVSSFQGDRRRIGFGWRGTGAADGTSGVAAPRSRPVSQFDWATYHKHQLKWGWANLSPWAACSTQSLLIWPTNVLARFRQFLSSQACLNNVHLVIHKYS